MAIDPDAAAKKQAADEEEAKRLAGSLPAADSTTVLVKPGEPDPDADPTTLGREREDDDTTLTGAKDDSSKKPPREGAKKPDDSGISPWEKIWDNVGMALRGVDETFVEGGKLVYKKVNALREKLAAQKNNGHELAPHEGEAITPAHNKMQQQRGSMSPPEPDEKAKHDNGTPKFR